MYYTYILKSIKTPGAIYIGYTGDLTSRLEQHNDPQNTGYTRRHAPWEIETSIAFSEKEEAQRFELYLKSSSGKAFMKKRLLSGEFREVLEKFNNGR
ncbi:MAG: GIY-YIG nuclease family protein [Nitrospirae bacterium]|nr:GIY-YIG nuclease family protein [Nitrospirota bacterium]